MSGSETKNEPTHTPGPWEIEYDNDDNGGGQWFQVGPAKISFSYNCTDEEARRAAADADLIAAAPETKCQRDALLEALENMVALARPYFTDDVQMLAIKIAQDAIFDCRRERSDAGEGA